MFEKVNPKHPDKIADRIAGAIVDLAYSHDDNPKVAVEVLIGHNTCLIINETSVHIPTYKVEEIVRRIAEDKECEIEVNYTEVPQDAHLAKNQESIKCGDNGIFKGTPITEEQAQLVKIAHEIYDDYLSDGKYILSDEKLTICQSKDTAELLNKKYPKAKVNPLGYWDGGINVDSGATNRKLGSDMGDGVTGGGLHGKDLSKADVTLNIYCFLKAQEQGHEFQLSCSIGDDIVDGNLYSEIVEIAREYIKSVGGFEKFAEWGLIR